MHQFIMNIASHRCPSFGSLPDLKTAQGMFNKFQDKFKKKLLFNGSLLFNWFLSNIQDKSRKNSMVRIPQSYSIEELP